MKLERILIADDNEENRNAARVAIPNATIVSSAKEAIAELNSFTYDLVISDMQMETPLAGLDVIKESMKKATIAYTLSHTGPSHQGTSTSLSPYGSAIYNQLGKATPQTWSIALERIASATGVQENYHQAVLRARSFGIPINLDDSIVRAIYYPFRIAEEKNDK